MALFALRRRRRPRPRPHPRRLAHRHLLLALRLLHQHPHRHPRGLHDQPLRPRPALHQERQSTRRFDNLGFGLLVVWTGCLQIILDKGQEDDWFGAIWIRWAFCFSSSPPSLWFICPSPGASTTPLVNLSIFKDRNFAVGCLLIFLFGVAIYSTITVLPLFYQELLGYTAFTAGLVVSPRGIGAICAMPIIGYLYQQGRPALPAHLRLCPLRP